MIAPAVPMSRYPPSSVHYTASSTDPPSISSFAVPVPVPINPRPGVVGSTTTSTGAASSASIGYPIYKTSSVVAARSLNGLGNSNISQLHVVPPPATATGVVSGQDSEPQASGSIFGHRLFGFMGIDPDKGGESGSGEGQGQGPDK